MSKKTINTVETSVSLGFGCFGCLSLILFAFLLWALVYGVTIGGRHYSVSCTTEHGVALETHD